MSTESTVTSTQLFVVSFAFMIIAGGLAGGLLFYEEPTNTDQYPELSAEQVSVYEDTPRLGVTASQDPVEPSVENPNFIGIPADSANIGLFGLIGVLLYIAGIDKRRYELVN
jgi:hypothetical protein